jgi:hypothetical protein
MTRKIEPVEIWFLLIPNISTIPIVPINIEIGTISMKNFLFAFLDNLFFFYALISTFENRMERQLNTSEEIKKRPELLTILCILSFIWSGLQGLSNIFVFTNLDMLLNSKDKIPFLTKEMQQLFETSPTFFLLNSLFFFFSFTGVLLMWKLHKVGFHIYSLAQIAILFVVSIYKPFQVFPLAEILITALFILLYFRHLKFMN